MKHIFLIFILIIVISANTVYAKNKVLDPAKIYIKDGQQLSYVSCTFHPDNKKIKNPVYRLKFSETIDKKETTYQPLYTVFKKGFDAKGEFIKCIFRINADVFEIIAPESLHLSLQTNSYNYYTPDNQLVKSYKIIKNPTEVAQIEQEWKNEFKGFLINEINANEDHEMELLLYLRFFKKLPPENKNYSWKKEPILKFLYTISGLNDISDAIPTEKKLTLKNEKYIKNPPTPILLPQVASKEVSMKSNNSPLSKYIPRSCYYLEWDSMENFTGTFNFIASEYDKWSKGTYPKSFGEIYKFHLKRLGLFEKDFANLKNNVKAIVIAGWDLNIQSGTNLLMVIQTEKAISLSKSSAFQKSLPGNILILSTGKKLLKMAINCFDKGRSLSQVNNFKYSRKRLKCKGKKTEKAFMYLSDYWLTNFISPRWTIFNNRLNTIDAKIRMVYLLKSIYKAEKNSFTLPTLVEIKNKTLLPEKWNNWLFNGLEDKNGKIRHIDYGGLFNHQPIDTLKFKKVTETEYKNYESFKRIYQRRWRQMDPIALSIFHDNEEKKWGSVLYVSPISNRSNFRFVRGMTCNPKIKHSFDTFNGQAFGVSVAIATKMFGFWLRGVTLPMNLFVQFTGLDFASSSYLPAYWLEDTRKQSVLSFMRMPGAFAVPELLISGVTPMFRWVNRVKSQYAGIDKIDTPADRTGMFPLYILSPQNSGTAYLGLNPNTLSTIKNSFSKDKMQDSKACDIRVFLNFKNAYMMRRKLLQLAVKNRGIDAWRIHNRLFRISKLLGFEMSKEKEFKSDILNSNIFPTKSIISDYIIKRMPDLINHKSSSSWSRPIMDEFKKLPELFLKLLNIDFFVSIEDNAILIETDYQFDKFNSSHADIKPVTSNLRKTCINNMKVYEGALEMYHMDNFKEYDKKTGRIGIISDFPLLKENYIKKDLICPSSNTGAYIVNLKKNGNIEIECPFHGTIEKAEKQTPTPQPAQTTLDFDDE